MNVNFPFTCSCQVAGSVLIPEPVQIDGMYLARDCRGCGKTIIVIPREKINSAEYRYTVRICLTEREVDH